MRLRVGVRVEVVVGRAFGAVAGCEIFASECARVREVEVPVRRRRLLLLRVKSGGWFCAAGFADLSVCGVVGSGCWWQSVAVLLLVLVDGWAEMAKTGMKGDRGWWVGCEKWGEGGKKWGDRVTRSGVRVARNGVRGGEKWGDRGEKWGEGGEKWVRLARSGVRGGE